MGEFIRSFRGKVEGGSRAACNTPSAHISALLDAICGEQEDLEFLIEELDALISRAYLGQKSFNPNPPGMGSTLQLRWPGFQEVASEAKKLLASVKREVYLQYRSISDPAQTSLLAKPIGLLQTESQELTVVFTTNYDPAVEKFCANQRLHLTDGFTHDEHNAGVRMEPSGVQERPVPGTLVLFKLHGSANWYKERGRIIKGLPTYDVDDPDYENVMIYPATRKVATEDPFFTAYDYLEQCLDESRFVSCGRIFVQGLRHFDEVQVCHAEQQALEDLSARSCRCPDLQGSRASRNFGVSHPVCARVRPRE